MAKGIDSSAVVLAVSRSEIAGGRSVGTSHLLAEARVECDAINKLIDTVNQKLNPNPPLQNNCSFYDTLKQVIDLCKEIISDKTFIENFKKVLTHNEANMEFLVAVANDLTELIDESKDDKVKLYEFKIKIIKLQIKYFEEQIESKLGHEVLNLLKKPIEPFINKIDSLIQSDEGEQLNKYTKIFRLNNHILSQLNKIHTRLFQPIESEDINKIKSFLMTDIQNMIISYEQVVQRELSSEKLKKTLAAVKQELTLLQPSQEITSSLVFLCSVKKILERLDPTETNLLINLDNQFIKIFNENQSDADIIAAFKLAQYYCQYSNLKLEVKKFKVDESQLIIASYFETIQQVPDNEQTMENIMNCLNIIFQISEHIEFSKFKSKHEEIYEELKQYVDKILKDFQACRPLEDLTKLNCLKESLSLYENIKHMSKYISLDSDKNNYKRRCANQIKSIIKEDIDLNQMSSLENRLNKHLSSQYTLNQKRLKKLVSDFAEKSTLSDVSIESATLPSEGIESEPIQIFEKLYQCITSLIESETANLDTIKSEFNEKEDSQQIQLGLEELESHNQAKTCDQKLDALEKIYEIKKEYQLRLDVLNNRELLKNLSHTEKSDHIKDKSLCTLIEQAQDMLQLDKLKEAINNNTLKDLNDKFIKLIKFITNLKENQINKLIHTLTTLITPYECTTDITEDLENKLLEATVAINPQFPTNQDEHIEMLKSSIEVWTGLQKEKETQKQYDAQYETLSQIVTELNTTPNIPVNLSKAKGAAESFLNQLSETQANDIEELTQSISHLTAHIETLTSLKETHIVDLKQNQKSLIEKIKKYVSELEQVKTQSNELNKAIADAKSLLKTSSETQDIQKIKYIHMQLVELYNNIKKESIDELTKLNSKYTNIVKELNESNIDCKELKQIIEVVNSTLENIEGSDIAKITESIRSIGEKYKNYENQVIEDLTKIAQLETSNIKLEDLKKSIEEVKTTLQELDQKGTDIILLNKLKNSLIQKLLDYCNFYEMQKIQHSVVPMPITSKSRVELAYTKLQKIIAEFDSNPSSGGSTHTDHVVGIINNLNRLNIIQAELQQGVEVDYNRVKYLLDPDMNSLNSQYESILNMENASFIQQASETIQSIVQLKNFSKSLMTFLNNKRTSLTQTLSEIVSELKTTQNTSDEFKADIADAESLLDQLSESQADDIEELTQSIKQLTTQIATLKSLKETHIVDLKQNQKSLIEKIKKYVSELEQVKTQSEELNEAIAAAQSLLKTLSEPRQDGVKELTQSINQLTTQIATLTSLKETHIVDLKQNQKSLIEKIKKYVSELEQVKTQSEELNEAIAAAKSLLDQLSEPQADDIGELINNITQLRDKISFIKTILSNQHKNDKLKQDQDRLKKMLDQKLSALLIYFQNICIEPYESIIQIRAYLDQLNSGEENQVVSESVNNELKKYIKLAELAETMNKYYVLLNIYQICEEPQHQGFYSIHIQANKVLNDSNSDISIIQDTLNQLNKSIQMHQNHAQQILTKHQGVINFKIESIYSVFQHSNSALKQLPNSSDSTAETFKHVNETLTIEHQQLCKLFQELSVLEQSLHTQLHTYNDQ